ncbi:MAG TPA: 2-phospho-L-lactate transferase CofD family protein [Candidatus Paceibacterota bacterium]|nr:2-phospho-L-lactate transferase CofD family protein [Candidatus Paceibacterota bacterium]
MEAINVASIGGGNGQKAVVAALAMISKRRPMRVTAVTTSVDDDDPAGKYLTSTGRLAARTKSAGPYGDITRIFSGLDTGWLNENLMMRFGFSIAGGQTFGELLGRLLFGERFSRRMKNPSSRAGAIGLLRRIFGLDQATPENVRIWRLLVDVLDQQLEGDSFTGHSLGNYLLFTLQKVAERQKLPSQLALKLALEALHIICRIPGNFRVMPATWEPGTLVAKTRAGAEIRGQCRIDFRDRDVLADPCDRITDLRIDPPVSASEEAVRAILDADAVILSCGSIYGNLFGPFCADGLREALREKMVAAPPTPLIYVMNLMTKIGETRFETPCTAADVVWCVRKATGQYPTHVIVDTTCFPDEVMKGLLPEKKIEPGGPSFEVPRPVAKLVNGQLVHDPGRLALVFEEIFAGAHR